MEDNEKQEKMPERENHWEYREAIEAISLSMNQSKLNNDDKQRHWSTLKAGR